MFLVDFGSITDWITAVASLVAAIGVVFTLANMRSDNRRVQKQVDSLAEMARESQMRMRVLTSSSKPIFKCSPEDRWSAPQEFHFEFENIGGDAFDVKLIERNFMIQNVDLLTTIKSGDYRHYRVIYNYKIEHNFSDETLLTFKDAMGQVYEQKIEIRRGRAYMNEPTLVS